MIELNSYDRAKPSGRLKYAVEEEKSYALRIQRQRAEFISL